MSSLCLSRIKKCLIKDAQIRLNHINNLDSCKMTIKMKKLFMTSDFVTQHYILGMPKSCHQKCRNTMSGILVLQKS